MILCIARTGLTCGKTEPVLGGVKTESGMKGKGEGKYKATAIPWVAWLEDDFRLLKSCWSNICKLPNTSLNLGEILEDLISNAQLVENFGPYIRNNFYLSNMNLLLNDVLHLTQGLEGHEYPQNDMLG